MKFFIEMFIKVVKTTVLDSENNISQMLLKQVFDKSYGGYIKLIKENDSDLERRLLKDIESKNIDFELFCNNLVEILQMHRYIKEALELQEEYIKIKLVNGVKSQSMIIEYNKLANIYKEAHMIQKAMQVATNTIEIIEKESTIEDSMLSIILASYVILAELKQIETSPIDEIEYLCNKVFKYIEDSSEVIHKESKNNFLFRSYYLLTLSNSENKRYADTIKYANKLLEVSKSISQEVILSRVFTIKTLVANAYLHQNNPIKALEVAKEALKLQEKEPLLNLFEVSIVMSLIYDKLKEHDMALKIAKEVLPRAKSEAEFVTVYTALIDIYENKNDLQNREFYISKLINLQEQNISNNQPAHLSYLYEFAIKAYSKNDLKSAKDFALKMLNLAKEKDDFIRVHRVLVDIAIASQDWTMFDKYIKPLFGIDMTTEIKIVVDKHMQKDINLQLVLADKLLSYTKTEKERIKIYHMIISCYLKKGEYSKLDSLIGKLEQMVEKFKDESAQYIDICLILKDYFFSRGESRKANSIMDKLDRYLKSNLKSDDGSFLTLLVSINYNKAEQFKKVSQFDEAQHELLDALRLLKSFDKVDKEDFAQCYNILASLYLQQQEYNKTIEYTDKSLLLMGDDISLVFAHSYHLKHVAYRKLGKMQEAEENQKNSQKIKSMIAVEEEVVS